MACTRTAQCPTMPPTLMPLGHALDGVEVLAVGLSSPRRSPVMIESAGMSSTDSIISASSSRSASLHGANVTPQLPSTTEVTPCQHDDEPIGSQASWASRWRVDVDEARA